ncbi:hypothetical protein [Flavobacterium sp.]|uniref:hypothetical protein n=1 Tax=Flavobacterium sp. TaxID=239 RepID=UPI00374D1826
MKNKTTYLLATIFTFFFTFVSCSDSEDQIPATPDPVVSNTNVLPLVTGNYWKYDVVTPATATTPASTTKDSLYVENDMVINTIVYKKMKTRNAPTGFFCNFLNNNGLRVDGKKIKISGTVNYGTGLPIPIVINISDFIIVDEIATSGTQLSTTSGTFSQTVGGYLITFDYTLRSLADGVLPTYTVYGKTYSDLTKTKIIVNLKAMTTISVGGFPIPITVMNPQDVVVSNQYYSKNIGVVHNHTVTSYQLNSLPGGVTLPIPSSGTQTQDDFLDTYLTL